MLPPKPRAVVQAGMARTFQNIRLFPNMTALENVMVGRYCRTSAMALDLHPPRPQVPPRGGRDTRSAPPNCSSSSGLRSRAMHLARNLPYGDQRRLGDRPRAGHRPASCSCSTSRPRA